MSYNAQDPTPFYSSDNNETHNLIGEAGAWLAAYLFYWFGFASYLLVVLCAFWGYVFFYNVPFNPSLYLRIIRRLAGLLLILSMAALLTLHANEAATYLPASGGGVIGLVIAQKTTTALGFLGGNVILLALCLVSFSLITGLSWLQFLEVIGGIVLFFAAKLRLFPLSNIPLIPKQLAINILSSFSHNIRLPTKVKNIRQDSTVAMEAKKRIEPQFIFMPGKGTEALAEEKEDPPINLEEEGSNTTLKAATAKHIYEDKRSQAQPNPTMDNNPQTDEANKTHKKSIVGNEGQIVPSSLPSIDYLHQSDTTINTLSPEEYQILGEKLVTSLKDFGVIVQLKGYNPGPVVTLFELEPAAGVKAAKISNLSQDLARSMAVENIRVVEFISGKSFIGIEIPNQQHKTVRMRELLTSAKYKETNLTLPLALGQDTEGKPIIVSLADMPHLLVAGTTGSGKSIGINVMLISLLYRYSPEEMKLILIDPKMLELSVYNDIPHSLVPVITDISKASQGLNWCVKEMDDRYALMAQLGVRNIENYNRSLASISKDSDANNSSPHRHLPYLVIVIDEYADLIMTNKKVEDFIVRLAQKARAAGIHLILATQRPSVNVVTGLIKANIPVRISFKVSSRIDSRTILDQSGAEQLLGKGDMLYSASGGSLIKRIHGALIEDDEIHKVAEHWKKQGKPEYQEQLFKIDNTSQMAYDEEEDDLYPQAVGFIKENNRVSISSVQRKFKIGYNRAARIIELMEKNGLVSSMDSAGKRTVIQ